MNPYDEIEPGQPRPSRWRRRATAAVAVVGVLSAGTAGFAALNQRDGGGDPLQAAPRDAAPADVAPDAAAPAEENDADAATTLQWSSADVASGLSWSTELAVDGGSVYALSTAAGVRDPNEEWVAEPATLYSSADGGEWSALGVPADLWASSLEAAGGRLYAVGTGPAAAAEGDPYTLQVAASSDGGATWSNVDLPLDIAGLESRYGDSVSVGPGRVAVAPDGAVLATATVHAWADPYELLPDDVDQRWGVAETATGFDVYGPPADLAAAAAEVCPAEWVLQEDYEGEGVHAGLVPPEVAVLEAGGRVGPVKAATDDLWCVSPDGNEGTPVWAGDIAGPVAQSFTWEQLGVDAEFQALLAGQTHVFVAPDGSTFEEVAVDLPADRRISQLTPLATADGFALLVNHDARTFDPKVDAGNPTVSVLTSPDGRTWSPHPAGDLSGWIRSAGVVRDSLVVAVDSMTETDMSTMVATSTAGAPWAISSPAELVEPGSGAVYVGDISVGPLGVAAVVSASSDPIVDAGGVDIAGTAGYTLHVLDERGAAQVLDAGGAVVAETASIHGDRPDSVFDWDAGYTTLTVSDPASGAVVDTFTQEAIDGAMWPDDRAWQAPASTVVFSRDGVNWSAQPLSDLVGGSSNYPGVVVTDSAVVVRASFPTPEVGVPERQVVAIGTPA